MDHAASYYAATAHPSPARPPLEGDVRADVCVVGAGIAGCSAALDLAARGYRVVLLEARRVGWGASGRSGGQAIFGFGTTQKSIVAEVGRRGRAPDVGRLGRSAGAAPATGQGPRDRLRPELGPPARRDEAAAATRAASNCSRNSPRPTGTGRRACSNARTSSRCLRRSVIAPACTTPAAAICTRSITRSGWRAPPKRPACASANRRP